MSRKYLSALALLLACNSNGCECDKINTLLSSVSELPYIPELSGDVDYWSIVSKGREAVPCLIEALSDTTDTFIPVPNFGGNYRVGDIVNSIIQDIIHGLPISDLVNHVDTVGGYWVYWKYVEDYNNRLTYQKMVQQWYNNNRENLVWKEDKRIYHTSIDWPLGNTHPAGGYYIVLP